MAFTAGDKLRLSAQTANPVIKAATQFDEYGRVGGCDHSARLDNLAIQIQNNPDLEAYIVAYAPDGEGSGTGKQILDVIRDYLVNSRGIVDERIKTVYGGRNAILNEPRIQLWLSPHGAAPPEPTRYDNDVEAFKGKFAEYEAWDGVFSEGESTGPPIGDVTLAAFADILKQQQTAKAYIVAFNGDEAIPGAWHRVAQRDIESLKQYGVDSNRLKIIHGGNDKKTKVQLWIVPGNAPPPAVDAGPETPPRISLRLGIFNDYQLADTYSERWAFNSVAEALHLHRQLRACLIVRLGVIGSNAADDDTAEHNAEIPRAAAGLQLDEPIKSDSSEADVEIARADIPGLIEQWKSELTKSRTLDRLVVLFVNARDESEENTIETWIVPPGEPLPDPFAVAADEELDSESSSPPPPPQPSGKRTLDIKPALNRTLPERYIKQEGLFDSKLNVPEGNM